MPTVAKNIKDAIAETEKNKNNLTKAKTKIDNKIQNLGGQKPTNIFDVANKIEGMVNTQYKKIAMGSVSSDFVERTASSTRDYTFKTITLNINFIPKRIILTDICPIRYWANGTSYVDSGFKKTSAHIDTDYVNLKSLFYESTGDLYYCIFSDVDLTKKTLTFKMQGILGQKTEIRYNWVAIG